MTNKIRVNGILYESVKEYRSKFDQINIDTNSNESKLTIVNEDDNDYEILCLKFKKKGTKDYRNDYSEYDVVTLGEYEDDDYDEIMVAEKSSKNLFDKIVNYILDTDESISSPWDKKSVKKLFRSIKDKFNFVSMEEEKKYINNEWYGGYIDDDPWGLLVNGDVTFDDIEGYLVGDFDPDSYDKDEYQEYMRDSKRYKNSYYYCQGWMNKDGHIYSDDEMYL